MRFESYVPVLCSFGAAHRLGGVPNYVVGFIEDEHFFVADSRDD
jgi:hypothetical protein